MKTAVTVIVVFMTTVNNVYTENNTPYETTENSTVTNGTETESQVTQIVQNKEINDSVKNHSEENQELNDKKEPTYSSAREIAKKNLYTLVKIRLLGHLLQRLPIEKRQSIFIDALKKVSISGNKKSGQKGIAKAFSMQHRQFDDSSENGSGSQESKEKDTDKSTENVSPSDKNQENFDQETELQLQVIKDQVSNDVKGLLKTVFPGEDSNLQSASQGHYTHTANHNQHYDSDFESKEANSKYVTPVFHNVINPAHEQSTHPVHVPTHSFVSHSPYSEDYPLKQERIKDQLIPGTKVLPPPTTPFTIYQGPSLEVDPFKETLNLQPVTLKDYSSELPSSVTFLGNKMPKPDAKNKEGNSELFGLSNSYVNDHTTQSKNAHIVENDLSNSSEEKFVDKNTGNYHTTSNFLNMNAYPSSDVQDYYEDNFLTSDKTNVEEAVQMIYNLFNDYDDRVFDYENEKLNLDVELRLTTTLPPLDATQEYTIRATESSFTANPFTTAENLPTTAEDKNGNNSGESVEDMTTLKHDITYAPNNGSGEIHSMVQKKTKSHKNGNDRPNSDNTSSQELKKSKIESRDNHFHVVEDDESKATTQMYNTVNNDPDSSSSSEEMASSNVIRRYQSHNTKQTESTEVVKDNENNEHFSSEMEATLSPNIGENLFPLSSYNANKKTSEYEKTIINDKSIYDSRQQHASDSKDSWSSEESTLYNLLEKPFFSQLNYEVNIKDTLGDERKFGFNSEEEYGRDGGDGSKEDSNEFSLQKKHNFQHKLSLINELTTSGSPDVYVGKNVLHFNKGNIVSKDDSEEMLSAFGQSNDVSSQEKGINHVSEYVHENKTPKEITNSASHVRNALFPLQDKNNMFKESVSSSQSEGSYSAAQEDNSSPLENLIGIEKRNGHHSSDESRSSTQIDEYEMKQLLGELDWNLNNKVKDTTTYKDVHTSKDASSSEELGIEGDSLYQHKIVSSSQSTENLFDSLLKEGNIIAIDNENSESVISEVGKTLDSDSNDKSNVHKDKTDSGSTNTVEKQQFQESGQNSDSSDSDSADSTEDSKQFNANVHNQSYDGEKIQNRNNNESNRIFDSQSHENDDSLEMHKIESNNLFDGIANNKDASSSSEKQTNVMKKDISESMEKFKYDKIEDASNDKQEESSESQLTDNFEDMSVKSIPYNKDEGSSPSEHDSFDTKSPSKKSDFDFTNDNSMSAESKEDASETSNHDSNSVDLDQDNKINEMDSNGMSQEELVDDLMDEGSISHQIDKHFDVDSSFESKSVSEDNSDKDSFSTEFKNHISLEENALSSDSSSGDYSILKDKSDNLLSKETEDDYNLPGDKSSSCEENCESLSTEQDLFDKTKSSENESSEQNIPINKDYLPQNKNSESEQVMTSTKVNSSEESEDLFDKSSENESSEQNIPLNKDYLPQNKNSESEQVMTSTKVNSSEESEDVFDKSSENESSEQNIPFNKDYLPQNKNSESEQVMTSTKVNSSEESEDLFDKSSENESSEQNIPINKDYLPQNKNSESEQVMTSTKVNSSEESEHVFDKSSENESSEQNIPFNKDYLPQNKNSESEQVMTSTKVNSSEESEDVFDKSSENESSEQNIPINKDYLPQDKNSESEQVMTSTKVNSSEESEQTQVSEENEDIKEKTGKIESNKNMYENEYASNNDDKENSVESKQESKGFESEENISNNSEQAKNENPKIPEEPTPSSDEKREETKLQYVIEKVSGNEKRWQDIVDDSEQANNENPKNRSTETTESYSAEIPEEPTPSSDEKNEETKLQYIVEKVSGNEERGQESGDVDKSENEQSHDYDKLIVEKSVFDANVDSDDGGNGSESIEETTQRIIESSDNGNDYKSEEHDKIIIEKIQTNNGNSKENKNKQNHEVFYDEPKSNENPEQNHESIEKNKNEYQEDNKQKKTPNCDEKTNENKNVDDDILTKEISNDNDLEKAVEMISNMFVFDFDGSNRKKHTDYVSGKSVNTDSGYGKVGRVKSLIQKLVHLKKLWWKTKYGSKISKSSSSSVYGSGGMSRLNMKLPTLKNNLYENSNRRSFYGKKIHSNFRSFNKHGLRQPYHLPSFLVSSNYGSRDRYDRRPSAPYRPTLSKYLRGDRQMIYSPFSSNSRYGRPSYGPRKLKISFGDSSNNYDESQAELSRLSGILTKKPRSSVYGSRIGYDDSMYSRHGNFRNTDAHIFDSVDSFTNNDEDVIVHPVVTKSNY